MMWSGVEVQWDRAYALMMDEMVGHPMTGSPTSGWRCLRARNTRTQTRQPTRSGPTSDTAVGGQQQPAGSTEVRGF